MAAYAAAKVGSKVLKSKKAKKLGSKAIKAVKGAAGKLKGKGKKGQSGEKRRMSAKMRLKKAYERRAMRNIRLMRLGAARKDLYKKATVI
jgi:hypothetical protein